MPSKEDAGAGFARPSNAEAPGTDAPGTRHQIPRHQDPRHQGPRQNAKCKCQIQMRKTQLVNDYRGVQGHSYWALKFGLPIVFFEEQKEK